MRHVWIAALLAGTTLAACGGNSPVDIANKAADKACACADYDCAKEVVAGFNKFSFQEDDKVKALSGDDKTKYDAAVERMSQCRDKLKG